MNCTRSNTKFCKHPNDEVVWGFIFTDLLPTGVTIASIDSIEVDVEKGEDDDTLVVANEAVNVVAFDDDEGNEVAVGHAVRATVSSGTADVFYTITVTVTFTNDEKFAGVFPVHVEA